MRQNHHTLESFRNIGCHLVDLIVSQIADLTTIRLQIRTLLQPFIQECSPKCQRKKMPPDPHRKNPRHPAVLIAGIPAVIAWNASNVPAK